MFGFTENPGNHFYRNENYMNHPFIYNDYRFNEAASRRITNTELLGHITSLREKSNGKILTESLGYSFEGREIVKLKWGIGSVKILMWSQMHGNEPTATLALLDLFNLFNIEFQNPIIQKLYSSVSLSIIPMLNPDGAQRFQRRNALGIDLNRDALALQSPESNILKTAADRIKPTWGFNLHDQNPRYTVGNSGKVSAVSLLAPAFDADRNDNPVRLRAKKLCGIIADDVESRIGKHVGKYSDEFGPRCFGDNMQKWGISTVLIESGGWASDLNKDKIRELNFFAFLTSFLSIIDNSVDEASVSRYEEIPFNGALLTDVKFQNVRLLWSEDVRPIHVDLAINYVPMMDLLSGKEKLIGVVSELGDMRSLKAHAVEDKSKWTIRPMKPMTLLGSVTSDEIKSKITDGYCTFIYQNEKDIPANIPGNFIRSEFTVDHNTTTLIPGERASFRVFDDNDNLSEIWINGWKVFSQTDGWLSHEPFVMPNKVRGLEVEL